ncbi:hypothetical protein BH09MYX1_BH09MYX1_10770 [soil metagenome]
MKHLKLPLVVASSILLSAAISGCAVTPQPEADTVSQGGTLTFTEDTAIRAAGRFADDETAITFDITDDGTTRHTLLGFVDGRPILDSTLANGVDSTAYLGGRLSVKGSPTAAEPSFEGDTQVFFELQALPEAALAHRLRAALVEAHAPMLEADGASDIGTRGLMANYVNVDPGYGIDIPTWSFWTPTTVMVRNWSAWGAPFQVLDGWGGSWSYHIDGAGNGPAYAQFSGRYWGFSIIFWNQSQITSLQVYAF